MKQFFRLLIICLGLLLVLGLNEKQSGDSTASPFASSAQLFFEFSTSTPPSAVNASIKLWLFQTVQALLDHCQKTEIQREHIISTGIHARILATQKHLMKFLPGIPEKTGYLLHFIANRVDPSLA